MVAIEGDHLIAEAIRSGMVLKTVFLSERRELPRIVPRTVEVLILTDDVFSSVVETQSPQGIAALIVPPVRTLDAVLTATPLLLLAAGLQDPGNLGTLVRSAEAFGATGILTTPGTVNPWNQKALRASVGSIFRMPVVAIDLDQALALKTRGIHLLAAVGTNDYGNLPIHQADFTTPCAILIGNEGAGLAPDWLDLADLRITIPCPGPVESLNAAIAGSLILYEASRQRAAQSHQ